MNKAQTILEDTILSSVWDWVAASGLKIATVLLLFWAVQHFGRIVIQRIVARSLRHNAYSTPDEEEKRLATLTNVIDSIAKVALWFIAGMVVLSELNIDIAPLLAGASVFGVALGFGAQSFIKDFVAGLFIVLENQYRVGDIVQIAGVSGKVVSINLRDTVLRDLDGHVHYVPNGIIDVSTNMTMEYSSINITVAVAYDSDLAKMEQLINKVGRKLADDPEWAEYMIDPIHFVRVKNFNESSVDVLVLGKVLPGKQWTVAGEFRRRLKQEFDKAGVHIPFPQRVIHTVSEKKRKTTKSKR